MARCHQLANRRTNRARFLALPLTGLLAVACAHAPPTTETATETDSVIISLQDIACQSCGAASARALAQRDGVAAAEFDRNSAEVTVRYDPSRTTPLALVSVIEELGYEAELGAGKGRYLPEVEFPNELDVQWLSRDGGAVEIEAHKVSGKVTVFDFYAEWCGPCREVDREMLSVLRDNDDVALRKLNVIDWESGVAKQYLADIPSLPYVIVYSKTGKRIDAIPGLKLSRLRRAIDAARKD